MRWFFIFVLSVCCHLFTFQSRAQDAKLIVVANNTVMVDEINAKELSDYYLKKKRFWPDGTTVRPIDWTEGQPARQAFLAQVLGKSESELAQYWMKQKFLTGDQPPMTLDSSHSICSLLSTIKGSLSYVLDDDEKIRSCLGIKKLGEIK